MRWLRRSRWHYCLRLPSDVVLHGLKRYPIGRSIYPPFGSRFYRNVGSMVPGTVVMLFWHPSREQESWAVITDEPPSLQTLCALRFRVEELFWTASQAFELEDSRLRSTDALERLYLVAARASLWHDSGHGGAEQACVNRLTLHRRRGISYLKIGLRWLQGVLHKGRPTDSLSSPKDPQPCFASKQVERDL